MGDVSSGFAEHQLGRLRERRHPRPMGQERRVFANVVFAGGIVLVIARPWTIALAVS